MIKFTMSMENKIQILKPFGPSVAKTEIPDELVKKINNNY